MSDQGACEEIDRVASGFSRKNDASSQLPPEGGSHERINSREDNSQAQVWRARLDTRERRT